MNKPSAPQPWSTRLQAVAAVLGVMLTISLGLVGYLVLEAEKMGALHAGRAESKEWAPMLLQVRENRLEDLIARVAALEQQVFGLKHLGCDSDSR